MNAHSPIDAAAPAAAAFEHGVVRLIPLDKLKKSPRNVRRVPHSETAIAALAASIAHKGMLQMPVVEPEYGLDGEATGYFLVTVGEGRRLAQRLRAKRKQIKKTHPIACLLDLTNDPAEISLDENVTRSAMHPADQFEAFRDLAERLGWDADKIAARFGVTAHLVRQRLRLGAVSPKLMAIYREDGLTLDQLMAFAVSEDHDRQEQVYVQNPYNRQPYAIRRAMTEGKVAADDPRARFVGLEAYAEAGGSILRDLFTEDGGGWLEDVGLLDRLAAEKVAADAEAIRVAEGWKWAQGHVGYPSGHGLERVYPRAVMRNEEDLAVLAAISEEYDALTEQWAAVDDLPPEVEARLAEIDDKLAAFGEDTAYDPEDIARAGVFVIVTQDGTSRIERGLVRPEDRPSEPKREDADEDGGEEVEGRADGDPPDGDAEAEEPDGLTPLSDRLVADLTAHRTAALRDALASHPDVALNATVHALVLRSFYGGSGGAGTCVDIRPVSASLARDAEGIEDSIAERSSGARHALWARQLPEAPADLWAFVVGLDGDSRMSLLAHCVGLTVHAVRSWEGRAAALAHADALAMAVRLDMTAYWSATPHSYLGRVTKARIAEAVAQGVGEAAAARLADLKKAPMVVEAARLLDGTGWLPPLLQTAKPAAEAEVSTETDAAADEADTPDEVGVGAEAERAADAA